MNIPSRNSHQPIADPSSNDHWLFRDPSTIAPQPHVPDMYTPRPTYFQTSSSSQINITFIDHITTVLLWHIQWYGFKHNIECWGKKVSMRTLSPWAHWAHLVQTQNEQIAYSVFMIARQTFSKRSPINHQPLITARKHPVHLQIDLWIHASVWKGFDFVITKLSILLFVRTVYIWSILE